MILSCSITCPVGQIYTDNIFIAIFTLTCSIPSKTSFAFGVGTPIASSLKVKYYLYKITGVSTYEKFNISTAENVILGFFLFHPASVKNCREQPYGTMVH